jgi:hypothetical protein
MVITERINRKIAKHVRKGLLRRGMSKKTIRETQLLDWKYDQFIYSLALKGYTF